MPWEWKELPVFSSPGVSQTISVPILPQFLLGFRWKQGSLWSCTLWPPAPHPRWHRSAAPPGLLRSGLGITSLGNSREVTLSTCQRLWELCHLPPWEARDRCPSGAGGTGKSTKGTSERPPLREMENQLLLPRNTWDAT